jgi:trk system potassium uptake protein TrkH
VKVIRAISIVRGVRERIRDPFPEEVLSGSIDESASGRHSSANYHNASLIAFLWVGIYLLGVFALLVVLPIGQGPEAIAVGNVLFTVASAQGNVGLTSGIVTPSSPALPGTAKLALTANMWIGRLEVVPVLVFLRGLFWDVEAESE